MNHFDLFGLLISYSFDIKALDKSYLTLQTKYHPDRARSEEEKKGFLKTSTALNEAYHILKDDYKRAVYILKLQGIDVESENESYRLPTKVLEEIWNLRELLEDMEDTSTFIAQQEGKRAALVKDLEEDFKKAHYDQAAINTSRLKYLLNLLSRAKEKIKRR